MPTDEGNGDQSAQRHPIRLPEPVRIPAAVLNRHRARVLDPALAAIEPGAPRPEATAYRADTLLIPLRFAHGPDSKIGIYNEALQLLGVRLRDVIPETERWQEAIRSIDPELPVPVLLEPREDVILDRAPDPWAALVTLRRTFGDSEVIRGIGLNHLFMAASIVMEGVPVSEPQWPGHGGRSVSTGSITLHEGNRDPVRLFAPKPARRVAGDLPAGRRPVVAVLDTGIGTHPWLPIGDLSTDPVVEVSELFQQLLAEQEDRIATEVGASAHVLDSPMEDDPSLVQPLLGLLDSHAGHGTFATGLVLQNCPDSRVLALRIMHTDGFASEDSVLLALDRLRKRMCSALERKASDELIDVVSLSLGYYPETVKPNTSLTDAIGRLTDLGVLVVAAAGNDATTRLFLPAALDPASLGCKPAGRSLFIAIGALNAFGDTVAAFSNNGAWVRRWAPGNALVSTVPIDFQGAGSPSLETRNGKRPRTNTDPDDLRTGFAVWAGTSFATPVIAGLLAAALAEDADAEDSERRLERARQALRVTDDWLNGQGWLG